MAFDLTQTQFDSIRALNAGTDALCDHPYSKELDDMPELTKEQLAKMRPLYNAQQRAILMNNPTREQRDEILHTALLRLKQESKR
jgi:hypothetical protein